MKENNLMRTILVTGATSGIGKAIAKDLCKSGHAVVATGRSQDRLSALSAECKATDGNLIELQMDLNEGEDLAKAGQSKAEGSQVTGFVLCAGIGLPGTVLGSDDTMWSELVQTNFLSLMRQARSCANHFVENLDEYPDNSRLDIVIIGSTVGREISAKNPVYGATKAAVHSLTEALRREVCGKWIRVTLVEPAFVKSEFQENSGYDMDWVDDINTQIGPLLSPEDIARTVSFVMDQPAGVHIDDIRIRPTRQPV